MIILKSEPKAKPNNRKREQEKQRNTLYIIFTRVSARPAYAIFYQVLAETERFVWLARDHTLYPGSWSKWNWKLPLNKITSSVVQQTKRVNTKTFTASTLPPPPLFKWKGPSCWLQGTRLFHFWLDDAAVLYNFSCSAVDLTASVRCNEA